MALEDFNSFDYNRSASESNDPPYWESSTDTEVWWESEAYYFDRYFYKSYGVDYFAGDFNHSFEVEFTTLDGNVFLWVIGGKHTPVDALSQLTTHVFLSLGITNNSVLDGEPFENPTNKTIKISAINGAYSDSAPEYWIFDAADPGFFVEEGVKYYITISGDADGGANATGRIKLTVCTEGYLDKLRLITYLDMPALSSWGENYLTLISCDTFLTLQDVAGKTYNLNLDATPNPAGDTAGKATTPSPSHQDTDIELDTALAWTNGTWTEFTRTWLATKAEYEAAGTGEINSFKPEHLVQEQNTASTTFTPSADLEYETEYYWRVDTGTITEGWTIGDLWSFTTLAEVIVIPTELAEQASNPYPAYGEPEIPINPTCTWDLGAYTEGVNVYFSSHADYVGGIGETVGFGAAVDTGDETLTSYTPAELEYGSYYVWRIDTVNEDDAVTTGVIWYFSTLPYQPPINPESRRNVIKAPNDTRVFQRYLKKLYKRGLAKWNLRMWTTSETVAASVDATGLDTTIQRGDLVYSTGTGNNIFICTVIPSGDAGTFIKINT